MSAELQWLITESGTHSASVGAAMYIITTPGKGKRRPFIIYFPEGPSATTDTLREAKEMAQAHATAAHADAVDPEVAPPAGDLQTLIGGMIGMATLQIARQTERQAQAVQLAREHGLSWAFIGSHLGVTRQSAQIRFGRKTSVSEKPAQTETLELES